MSDDSTIPKRMSSTLPPPGDAEDLYSASTVVGQASAELLALVRSATEEGDRKAAAATTPPPSGTPPGEDPKLTAMKEAAARSAKQAAANEVAREAAKAASTRPPGASATTSSGKPAAFVKPASVSVPKAAPPDLAPRRAEAIEETSKRPAARMADEPRRAPGGRPMPPVVAIALVFAAAAFVLAAIVR